MTARTRLALTSIVAVVALGTAACTGSTGRGAGSTSAARASTSGSSSAPSSRPTTKTATDPRATMPAAKPATVAAVAYTPASSKDKARLAKVDAASADLIDRSTLRAITVAGKQVGTVGVYTVKTRAGRSPMFQDQYLVQLLNAVGGPKTQLKFVKVEGTVTAISTGAVHLAGWFSGDQVTVVVPTAAQMDLVGLAAGMQASPVKG